MYDNYLYAGIKATDVIWECSKLLGERNLRWRLQRWSGELDGTK